MNITIEVPAWFTFDDMAELQNALKEKGFHYRFGRDGLRMIHISALDERRSEAFQQPEMEM